MIRVMYNSDQPEIIFSLAAIAKTKAEKEFCFFVPTRLDQILEKGPRELPLAEAFKTTYGELGYDDEDDGVYYLPPFSLLDRNGKVKDIVDLASEEERMPEEEQIILLNLFPINNQEEEMIIEFYERYEEQILFWIDSHSWNKKLLDYLNRDSNVIFAGDNYSCLQILLMHHYDAPPEWLRAEAAVRYVDLRNPLAARYFKTLMVSSAAGKNYDQEEKFRQSFFLSAVDELTSGDEDYRISKMESFFFDYTNIITWAYKNFTDDHPIFARAKAKGRRVGYLFLDEIDDYIDVDRILDYGVNKFPWLSLVEFTFQGKPRLLAKSSKIPIGEIMASYDGLGLSSEEKMKIICGELLSYSSRKTKSESRTTRKKSEKNPKKSDSKRKRQK